MSLATHPPRGSLRLFRLAVQLLQRVVDHLDLAHAEIPELARLQVELGAESRRPQERRVVT